MSVRDYLNEGGKLVHTGETAGSTTACSAATRRHLLRPQRRPDGGLRRE